MQPRQVTKLQKTTQKALKPYLNPKEPTFLGGSLEGLPYYVSPEKGRVFSVQVHFKDRVLLLPVAFLKLTKPYPSSRVGNL